MPCEWWKPGTGRKQQPMNDGTVSSESSPRLRQSPLDPAFVQDPYPFYADARQHGDFVYWENYERVFAASYRAVNEILRSRQWGREIPDEFRPAVPEHQRPFMDIEADSMLEIDPPRHTRLRGLVLHAFTPRKIESLVPEIEALAEQLVSDFNADRVELLSAFGERLPVIIIARLLGVPDSMADQLLSWSHDMVAMYQARRDREIELKASAAAKEFSEFIRNLARERRQQPGDDLISRLALAETEEGRLSPGELASSCILLLNAGHEATVHTIGNGVKLLLEQAEAGAIDPVACCSESAVARTVDEILRFDPPLHIFDRFAKEDTDCLGRQFRRGDRVGLLLASANRDAAAFGDSADRFCPDRWPNRHLSFGAGVHFCLGAPLARIELAWALKVLFRRFPDIRMVSRTRYANLYHFHGLEALHVATG